MAKPPARRRRVDTPPEPFSPIKRTAFSEREIIRGQAHALKTGPEQGDYLFPADAVEDRFNKNVAL